VPITVMKKKKKGQFGEGGSAKKHCHEPGGPCSGHDDGSDSRLGPHKSPIPNRPQGVGGSIFVLGGKKLLEAFLCKTLRLLAERSCRV